MIQTIFIALLSLITSLPVQGGAVQLLRVIVLDTSGSMEKGGRHRSSISEIEQTVQAQPPSAAAPIALITFSGVAAPPLQFTSAESLLAHVRTLRPGGGTNIAAGLRAGVQEMQRYSDVPHVVLTLISDGEDSDQNGVDQAEEQLSRLFTTRKDKHLQNTVVAKSWDRANARLFERIRERGTATLVESGSARLLSRSLHPSLQILTTQWNPSTGSLEIELEGRLRVDGGGDVASLVVQANSPLLPAPISFELSTQNATHAKLVIPADRAPADGGPIDLRFHSSGPSAVPVAEGTLVSTVDTAGLAVLASAPPRKIDLSWNASISSAGSAEWSDPLSRKMKTDVDIELELHSASPLPIGFSLVPRIEALDGWQLAAATGESSITQIGKHSLRRTLERDSVPADGKVPAAAVRILLDPAPKFVHPDPIERRLVLDAAPPSETITTIRVDGVQAHPARWCRIIDSAVELVAEVSFKVDGPIAPDTKIVVESEVPVEIRDIDPSQISTGSQVVKFLLRTRCDPDAEIPIALRILPPSNQGAVRFNIQGDVQLTAVGPPAATLLISEGSELPLPAQLELADNAEAASLTLCARIEGDLLPGAEEGLRVRWSQGGASWVSTLGEPIPLSLSLPPRSTRSWIWDTTVPVEVLLESTSESAPLLPDSRTIHVMIAAPLKRLLMVFAAFLLGTAIVVCLWRAIVGSGSGVREAN
ncbi:MAG: VWA domain-containing protein [Planctomycetes bacterium]|nr:VWA domain-containing protein [Planctomycetota bacterium]